MSDANQNEMRAPGAAFLMAQTGAHAAAKFAERLRPLKLVPAHAGILRAIHGGQGINQQQLARHLGMFPSRLVLVLDELERMGLIERKSSARDRRVYALHLTARGRDKLRAIGRVAQEHQAALLAALSDGEKKTLATLLARIADQQGLTPGVHPGFREIGRGKRGAC